MTEIEGLHDKSWRRTVERGRERERETIAAMQLHRRCIETAQFRGYAGVMHYRLAVQPTLHGADRIAFR